MLVEDRLHTSHEQVNDTHEHGNDGESSSNDVRQQVDHCAEDEQADQNFHGLILHMMMKLAAVEITVHMAMAITATLNANSICLS